jgi:hypothetical protein
MAWINAHEMLQAPDFNEIIHRIALTKQGRNEGE